MGHSPVLAPFFDVLGDLNVGGIIGAKTLNLTPSSSFGLTIVPSSAVDFTGFLVAIDSRHASTNTLAFLIDQFGRTSIGGGFPTQSLEINSLLGTATYGLANNAGRSRFADHLEFTAGSALNASKFSIGVDNASVFRINATSSHSVNVSINGVDALSTTAQSPMTIVQAAASGGQAASALNITGGAHTSWTASTRFDLVFNLARTVTINASPTLLQTTSFTAPTYAFSGATSVNLVTGWSIDTMPQPGTNATFNVVTASSVGTIGYTGKGTVMIGHTVLMPGIGAGFGNVTELDAFSVPNVGQIVLGDQTANLVQLSSVNLSGITYKTTSGTRTITGTAATLVLGGPPVAGSGIVFSQGAQSLYVNSGESLFNGIVTAQAGFTHKAGTLAFFNATPTTQPVVGSTLNNNVTVGGSTGIIANFTDLTVYANDSATIRNNFYQITKRLKDLDDAVHALGLAA